MHARKKQRVTLTFNGKTDYKTSTTKLLDNFKQGDILFGLTAEKRSIVDKLSDAGYRYISANQFNAPVIDCVVSKAPPKNIAGVSFVLQNYYQLLITFRSYLLKDGGKTIIGTEFGKQATVAIRRACKLLVTELSRLGAYRAHVFLKGISMESVCLKVDHPLSMTNSEIRAIYRDFLKNGKNPNLFFYNDKQELMTQPPWEDPANEDYFIHYDMMRAIKPK